MGQFILDQSKLSGAVFSTKSTPMEGDFRDIQFHWTQSVSSQDAEIHYFEFHFDVSGVSEE